MNKEKWDIEITAERPLMRLNLREIWNYRDALFLFVHRDFVTHYKQTILGPLWFFVQPLLTTLIFTLVFNRLARLSTDGAPAILFYLAGITFWNYFSDTLNKTSTTFIDNQSIFGKVYFPRMIVPISVICSHLVRFGIQLLLFLGLLAVYLVSGADVSVNLHVLLFPVLVLIVGGLSLGLGLMVTSLTSKYRDLVLLLQFGIQLLMFATPIIYPLSAIPERFQIFSQANPLTAVMETVRYGFLGTDSFSWLALAYSGGVTVIVLLTGVFMFNRAEKNFIDTV